MSGPYTVTVKLAYPGTPLFDDNTGQIPTGETSQAGHMWYSISDGQTSTSYGFRPLEAGAIQGPGEGVDTDDKVYQNPGYTRALEITAEPYERLREYGEDAVRGDSWRYFNGRYHGVANSCIDFTWGALRHAGLQQSRTAVDYFQGELREEVHGVPNAYDGSLKVMPNRDALRKLVPPVPGSDLNQERENPPPERTFRQRLFTENDAMDGHQAEAAREAGTQREPQFSPIAQTLLHDARREVQGLAQQHGLAWDQGLENAVWSLAAAARGAGLSRIEMSHVESGQIRLGQMDHGQLRVTEVDAHRAANTAPEQSAQTLSAADQQAQAHALERDQNAHTHARSGPVLA